MRKLVLAAALALLALAPEPEALARSSAPREARSKRAERPAPTTKEWCAPEVHALGERTCYFEGDAPEGARRTLVIYLHGMLATSPGFQYLQQRAMALHAKNHHFTVLMPTAPLHDGAYVWPTSEARQKEEEARIVAEIAASKRALEARVRHGFDEVFVVGFSSGAYYASTAAVRGVLDVDGYIILAGGSSWARGKVGEAKRVPVFVGVSAKDRQTRDHSRAFGGTLAALGWPHRVEERPAGHMVDWTFMAHGLAWLRARTSPAAGGAPHVRTVF